ncbi:hypothetical protein FNV43_RR15837 [Rhamnella rubrinervis]|uniref:Protein ABIL5 n=1 Tax=Rhamnella rubrinervis TaxID=2594499 RepID=A0A8K0ED86_9ROSA|nr:hypothetical protein FNV43_RR15837 [Rhamnella rubrinervis]
MQNSKASSEEDLDSESKDVTHFDQSLQELRDLRSQLHYAADYCESTFLNAKEKKAVVENTKEYLCRAVVTVVDHLGCVSANLNCLVSETNAFSAAELRINCLKQRLLSCELYANKLSLSRVRWSEIRPRHHSHYLLSSAASKAVGDIEKSNEGLRDSGNLTSTKKVIDEKHIEVDRDQDGNVPLFFYTFGNKPAALAKDEKNSALALPVGDGLSALSKCPNPTFHFQEKRKNGRNRKSAHGSDILALIRRAKRTP